MKILMTFTGSRPRVVLACAAALVASLWLGYQLRFDFAVPDATERTFPLVFGWVIAFKLFCLWRFRQFEVLLNYFSLPDFSRLCRVLLATCLVVFGVSSQLGSDYAPCSQAPWPTSSPRRSPVFSFDDGLLREM